MPEKQTNYEAEILKFVEKNYGEGILTNANDILDSKPKIVSISPNLDIITSGGIPEGCFVSISGAPKLGKTVTALTIAANAQKLGKKIYYGNVEYRLKRMNLVGTRGLELSQDKFQIIASSPQTGKILSAKDHLEIYCNILRTQPGCVLIIDSLSALSGEKELSEGIGTNELGGQSKYVSQFCRIIKDIVYMQKSIVIGMTHIMANPGGYGASKIEKAANEWIYQADIRLKVDKVVEYLKDMDKVVGQKVQWTCQASALGPPQMQIESYIRYGVGIDRTFELIEYATSIGLIQKKASWFKFQYNNEEVLEQGIDALHKKLSDNPQLMEFVENAIKSTK